MWLFVYFQAALVDHASENREGRSFKLLKAKSLQVIILDTDTVMIFLGH